MIPWRERPSDQTAAHIRALTHARRKLHLEDEAALPKWVEQLAHHPPFLRDILNSFSRALLEPGHLDAQSAWCVAVALGNHLSDDDLLGSLIEMASQAGTQMDALCEATAICASIVGFNMQHAFRGYVDDASFEALPVGLRQSTTQTPGVGQNTAHLIGVVVSVHSGCGRCVRYHTAQAREGGLTPAQINHAMQIGGIIASLCSFSGER